MFRETPTQTSDVWQSWGRGCYPVRRQSVALSASGQTASLCSAPPFRAFSFLGRAFFWTPLTAANHCLLSESAEALVFSSPQNQCPLTYLLCCFQILIAIVSSSDFLSSGGFILKIISWLQFWQCFKRKHRQMWLNMPCFLSLPCPI